jgi:hypothetical protein
MQKGIIIQATIVLVILIALVGLATATEKPGISILTTPSEVTEAGPTGTIQAVFLSPVCNLINFEGLGDNQPIGVVVGSVTVTFGSSWLSLIDYDAGGSGNFANEPSPSTTAYFLDQNDISINFNPGVQSVEFWYSAAAQSLPVHVIAYDEAGNLVDDNTGNAIGTSYDGAICAGDPNGDFCSFSKLNLESTANNIKRIQIIGTVSNYFGIDNLSYCIARCTPEGDEAIKEEISGFGSCPPEGIKSPTWGQFGSKEELVADSGEKLQVECHDGHYFLLLYTAPGEPTRKIGLCPFWSGCNSAYFWHSGDSDGNGKPDCFIRTRWISRDYGDNDRTPNSWTGEWDIPLENLVPPKVHLLDWAESVFDANTGMLTKTDHKYEYVYGPPVVGCGGIPSPEGNLFDKTPVTSTVIDPPVGPETEAFYDAVIENLLSQPPEPMPMGEDTTPKCDLNRDGICDDQDMLEFMANLGKCYWELGYNPFADVDGNGCLTMSDLLYFSSPLYIDGNGVADALTDGILILRYLFGFRGDTLIDGAVSPDCTRCTAPEIEAWLADCVSCCLDIDGNGEADALTDGILILRYLFGFTGDDLINGAVAPDCTRCTAPGIEAYIQGLMP